MIFERLERLFSHDYRRRRLLARAPTGPLRDYLATPFPSPDTPSNTLACLALDLETTGGDPARDEIVSFGWVCMDGERIDLGSVSYTHLDVYNRQEQALSALLRVAGSALDVM